VALAATLHDPPGALVADVRRFLPVLQGLYRSVAVAATEATAPALRELLAAAGAGAPTPRANLRGPLYRSAIRSAAESGAGRVHYLDFDRALHWLRRAPRELPAVLRLALRHRVLVLGRTSKAHRSHQLPLYATETLVNRLMAARLGLAGRVDLLVPSFTVTNDAALELLARSRARDATIYGELAILVAGLAREMAYVECRGLDWETPDRHRRAIRRTGLAAWRRRQETPAEWALRLAMAEDILAGFDHAFARGARAAPTLRRLPPRVG
jgi:hypothetical protein